MKKDNQEQKEKVEKEEKEENKEHKKPWSPLTVEALSDVFRSAPFFWCIAGGHAIELALGRRIRAHGDIDVLILRRDHQALRHFLADWDCWVADPPGTMRPWRETQALDVGIHDVWCRRNGGPWAFQVMIDEADEDMWHSRRNDQIRLPVSDIFQRSANGVPYLMPHIQLFYKAKRPRDVDELDFQNVMQNQCGCDVAWLQTAIQTTYGSAHPWLSCIVG